MIKKIAHERLTSLVFREDCLVTACQDGYVCTWARPGSQQATTLTAMGGGGGVGVQKQHSPGEGKVNHLHHLQDDLDQPGSSYSGAGAPGGPGTVV